MSVEENKALVREVLECVNRRDLDGFFGLLAPDFVFHSLAGDMPIEQFKPFARKLYLVDVPDLEGFYEDMIAEGEKVVTRGGWTGTHKGALRGIAPTGNKIKMTNMYMYRISGGKIAEMWNEQNELSLMQQIGAVPRA